jgi:isoleucyl-tRNA synthetase
MKSPWCFKPMTREADLIDVWFDSGSMPYAQWHYPLKTKIKLTRIKIFLISLLKVWIKPVDGFILYTIATLVFDSSLKNVVSNGLVLDKNGQKMSKRLEMQILLKH